MIYLYDSVKKSLTKMGNLKIKKNIGILFIR